MAHTKYTQTWKQFSPETGRVRLKNFEENLMRRMAYSAKWELFCCLAKLCMELRFVEADGLHEIVLRRNLVIVVLKIVELVYYGRLAPFLTVLVSSPL